MNEIPGGASMSIRARVFLVSVIVATGALGPSPRPSTAQTVGCTALPAPDPKKSFFENFLNNCYAIPLHGSKGKGNGMTDLDQTYAGFFYRVDPRYELILLGEFPRARYLSIKLDDGHFLTQEWFYDAQLRPLAPAHINPFLQGTPFKEDQLYAVTIGFGGAQPDASAVLPGCGLGGLNLHANVLDATKRHEGITWTGKPDTPVWFPPHDDAGPNGGGLLTVRMYMEEQDGGGVRLAVPLVLARDLTTGCAVPASEVLADDLDEQDKGLITGTEEVAANWIDVRQVFAHQYYRSLQRPYCHRLGPAAAHWFKPEDYLELPNPDADYLIGRLSPGHLEWVLAHKGFVRLQFRLPVLPQLPCNGCALNGNEELRYFSLSFFDAGKKTLATLGEFELARDPAGYVTVIVGFGSAPPAHVTAENHYTYLDLSAIDGYQTLSLLGIRTILASPEFHCSPKAVASFSSEDNSVGGFMGEYTPMVDVLPGSSLPSVATPLGHPHSCGQVPPEPAALCSLSY